MRNDLKLPRAPHLTFVQYISTFLSPLSHTDSCRPDLSWLELASWNVRDSICRLGEGCQVKGGVKKGSHPEGSPGPMKSTSLGLCVRRVKGEECLPGCMPAGQGIGPGFPFAPLLRGLSRQPSNQEILLRPESQLLLKINFFLPQKCPDQEWLWRLLSEHRSRFCAPVLFPTRSLPISCPSLLNNLQRTPLSQ